MEEKIPKQPVKDHHGFFDVTFADKPERHKEVEEQHQSKQEDSGE